jgi:hypothetical protein
MTSPEAQRARAEIRPVKQRIEDELLSRPDVTGVDINYKVTKGEKTGRMAIVVSVREKKPKRSLKAEELIPPEIEGIPTDVVEEEIVLHAVRAALEEVEPQVDAAAYSTLQGGISMGPCRSVYLTPPGVPKAGYYLAVGTLGAIVKDRTTGEAMALTNFHVACVDSTWAVGNTMTQQSRLDGGSCPSGKFGALTRAVLSDHVDGSVVHIDSAKTWACKIAEIGDVKGKSTASVGMAVRKRGRTTGLTYGNVTSVDYSTSVPYGNGLGVHTLKNQIRVEVDTAHSTQFGDHGDSGSVVVDTSNKVVGLHFAGNTAGTMGVANPIQFVLDELNVDLCTSGISLVTRPIVCDPLVTRATVCVVVTRTSACSLVTRPKICSVVTTPSVCVVMTRPGTCPVVTRICPVVTRICPPVTQACPGPDPGPFVRPPAPAGEADPTAWYGTPAGDELTDAFWAGYYAALDAMSEAEADAEE